ncbi:MAG: hypothetical protein KAR42_16510 [candidate division Zixibacteria bacterium]|nr:hypothetical protein [candidate division Zixibacteria bacterium]
MDKYSKKPLYFITDLAKIRVDPILAEFCVEESRGIAEKYFYPDGIARYGFELSRVALLRGYREFLHTNPNLFSTRQEAFAYI